MEKIYFKKNLLALRVRKILNGSKPITDGKEPLQAVTLKHPKGKYLQAHLHMPKIRQTQKLQECLIILKGKIRVDLYDNHKKFCKYIFLKTGDILISISGGYGIHIIKDCEMIEIKNGPFIEDKVLI